MFELLNNDQQGDLGEARAIFELTRLGYILSKPLINHVPYDLIADKNGVLYRVQVKTSQCSPNNPNIFAINLVTSGGNTKVNIRRAFDHNKVDLLFVLVNDGRCWLIPTNTITAKTSINVGAPDSRYNQYQL